MIQYGISAEANFLFLVIVIVFIIFPVPVLHPLYAGFRLPYLKELPEGKNGIMEGLGRNTDGQEMRGIYGGKK